MSSDIIHRTCSICENIHMAQGFCWKHYIKRLRSGELSVLVKKSLPELFWSHVQKTDDCWLWTGSKCHNGYGNFQDKKKHLRAHRFSWELHNGPIPDNMCILHICDTPGCVRPTHLFIGSLQDNSSDMVKKGRNKIGEDHHKAILTEIDVIDIMNRARTGENQGVIAEQYGVGQPQISAIKLGKSWKHITAI